MPSTPVTQFSSGSPLISIPGFVGLLVVFGSFARSFLLETPASLGFWATTLAWFPPVPLAAAFQLSLPAPPVPPDLKVLECHGLGPPAGSVGLGWCLRFWFCISHKSPGASLVQQGTELCPHLSCLRYFLAELIQALALNNILTLTGDFPPNVG